MPIGCGFEDKETFKYFCDKIKSQIPNNASELSVDNTEYESFGENVQDTLQILSDNKISNEDLDKRVKLFHAQVDGASFQYIKGSADFTYADALNTENCFIEVEITGFDTTVFLRKEEHNFHDHPNSIAGRYIGFSTVVRHGYERLEYHIYVYDPTALPTDEINAERLVNYNGEQYCSAGIAHLLLGEFLDQDIVNHKTIANNSPTTKAVADYTDNKITTFHAKIRGEDYQYIKGTADFTYEQVRDTEFAFIEIEIVGANMKIMARKEEHNFWQISGEEAGRYVGFHTVIRHGYERFEFHLYVYDPEGLPTDETNVARLADYNGEQYCSASIARLLIGEFLNQDVSSNLLIDNNAPTTKAVAEYVNTQDTAVINYANTQDTNILNYMQDTFAKNIMALVADQYAPHIVYESDGIYANNKNPKSCDKYAFDVPVTAEYKRLKFYIHTNTSDFGNRTTPAMIVEMILDGNFNTDEGMYLAGAQASNPQDGNTEFVVLVAVDSDLSGFRFVATNSLYGTTRGGRNDNGRKLYKIEAYKN